jgi:hypothetical protein
MSSSRALASSRAKRGGLTNEPVPNRPSNSSNQGSSNQNSSEIITIPSAITLITLRLGKLETYIQKLESEILPTLYNPTNTILPYNNINNNNLEEKINELTKKITNIELEISLLKSKPVVSCSCSANENTSEITKLKDLILFLQHKTLEDDKLQELTNEISKVKDLVLYLQNNSLEVNEKLINILFNSMSEEEEAVEEVVEEVVEEAVVEGEKEPLIEKVVEEVVVEEQFVEKNE